MADAVNNTTSRDWFGYGASGVAGAALGKGITRVPGLPITEPLNLKMIPKVPGVARTAPGVARLLPGMGVAGTGGITAGIALPVYLTKKLADWRAENLDSQYQGNHLKLLNELGGSENNPEDNEGDNLAISLVNQAYLGNPDSLRVLDSLGPELARRRAVDAREAIPSTPEVGSSDSSVLTRKGDFKGANTEDVTISVPVPTDPLVPTIENTTSTPTASSTSVSSSGSSYTPPRSRSTVSASRTASETSKAIKNAAENPDAYTERNNGINWGNLLMMLGALGGAYALGRRH
ncbi:MAG: hypothetical protein IJV29_14825 [Butyrivibrio sp.]|nr:hypothetical protein [Butyrivibrio sp.]